MEKMETKCPYCGGLSPKDAVFCASCGAKFTWLYWTAHGFPLYYRRSLVSSIIIALVVFPVTIGMMAYAAHGFDTKWLLAGLAISLADTFTLYIFRKQLMKIGWYGEHNRFVGLR